MRCGTRGTNKKPAKRRACAGVDRRSARRCEKLVPGPHTLNGQLSLTWRCVCSLWISVLPPIVPPSVFDGRSAMAHAAENKTCGDIGDKHPVSPESLVPSGFRCHQVCHQNTHILGDRLVTLPNSRRRYKGSRAVFGRKATSGLSLRGYGTPPDWYRLRERSPAPPANARRAGEIPLHKCEPMTAAEEGKRYSFVLAPGTEIDAVPVAVVTKPNLLSAGTPPAAQLNIASRTYSRTECRPRLVSKKVRQQQ